MSDYRPHRFTVALRWTAEGFEAEVELDLDTLAGMAEFAAIRFPAAQTPARRVAVGKGIIQYARAFCSQIGASVAHDAATEQLRGWASKSEWDEIGPDYP